MEVDNVPPPIGVVDESHFEPSLALHGLLDFTIDGEFGFEDVAAGLSNLPTSPSHYFSTIQPLNAGPGVNSGEAFYQQKHIALGIEAYKQSSLGVWEPSKHDHGGSGIESLSALGPSPPESLSLPQPGLDQSHLDQKVPIAARDEILSMVLESCKPSRWKLVTKGFPTPGLLGTLIQSFFAHHRHEVDSFMHEPSFIVCQQRPELLASIVSSGASLTDSKLLHMVGFAMEETLRTSLRRVCEDGNAVTRKLWLLQAFLCHVEVGMWSGIKRKIEISESHRQHPYTVCVCPVFLWDYLKNITSCVNSDAYTLDDSPRR